MSLGFSVIWHWLLFLCSDDEIPDKCALRKNKGQTVSTSALLREERVYVATVS